MGEVVLLSGGCRGGKPEEDHHQRRRRQQQQQQGQVLDLVLAALRKSVVLPCQMADADDPAAAAAAWGMEIGWPTDVRHVAHVTFDRLQGFLGLPVEFELEIPGHVPSASASVFGVSPESMQCGYDEKGNSIPKILLLMQERLYSQDGLKAEGIFRITPENSQEEHVREQLNRGVVPDDIDVHCLSSLIKAWFRELPQGVLDSISPEEVLHCNTEEQCVELVKLLPLTQAALLSWVVELMADVVEEEDSNKMNARNVAMVFAPNMTQMSDPLTALMHAVQVMNLLKTLILKTLREREYDDYEGSYSTFSSSSSLSDGIAHDHHDIGTTDKCCGDRSESPEHIGKASVVKLDDEQLVGASRRHTSFEFRLPYNSDDEDLSIIEEGFIRRLERQEVSKGTDEDDDGGGGGGSSSSFFLLADKEAERASFIGSEMEEQASHETSSMRAAASSDSGSKLRQTGSRNEITCDEVKVDMERELVLCS